jgi:Uma2 family endonuclease
MSHSAIVPSLVSAPGEPTWEIARLFPEQGAWSEEEYLELSGNHLIEFSNGSVEVLAMPTQTHQLIALYLYRMLAAFVEPNGLGRTLAAPFRVRLWPGKYREPDVLFMLAKHASRMDEIFWEGADLVMEVVSDDDRRRDLDLKRREYALAKIPEYWIVDPQESLITVLRLDGDHYAVHGEFGPGTRATSLVLSGFVVDVGEVFARRT